MCDSESVNTSTATGLTSTTPTGISAGGIECIHSPIKMCSIQATTMQAQSPSKHNSLIFDTSSPQQLHQFDNCIKNSKNSNNINMSAVNIAAATVKSASAATLIAAGQPHQLIGVGIPYGSLDKNTMLTPHDLYSMNINAIPAAEIGGSINSLNVSSGNGSGNVAAAGSNGVTPTLINQNQLSKSISNMNINMNINPGNITQIINIDELILENYALREKLKEITNDRDRLLCEVSNLRLELDMQELKRLPELER
ncbi:uncharacterized protein LOC129612625 isoform X2 [Condylostylus longicornis]|uniref:uncharacterized protein LOC129612625 isoform X1 n=1 Tax=Condylostylus longicornis TaxID=2530218 RepID=UPI00244DE226|nr:uncharacterized protein LOC129612625 isoform X1 [Condylostylus longicornis]XP_055382295.1 uncharacterized protein LOC129612625 isoform X2 [Condylostylus longicornis]